MSIKLNNLQHLNRDNNESPKVRESIIDTILRRRESKNEVIKKRTLRPWEHINNLSDIDNDRHGAERYEKRENLNIMKPFSKNSEKNSSHQIELLAQKIKERARQLFS